jgi:ubiquinone/menaquinone biosynthesis C-methylase UbiE
MADSVSFDRAAECYDASRAISEESMARNVELILAELGGAGRVLEVGVGTGLLGLPLRAGGLDLVGLDLSRPMMAKLLEKAGGTAPFPLVGGDATAMPFRDGAFGGAYLRWVLHLIPRWEDALAEIRRVLGPGGRLLVNLGAYAGERQEIQQRFSELTGTSVDPVGLGWGEFDRLDRVMEGLGAASRSLPPVDEGAVDSLGEFLKGIEESRYSWTWSVEDDVRLRAYRELLGWARERYGPLEDPAPRRHATRWQAYDLP